MSSYGGEMQPLTGGNGSSSSQKGEGESKKSCSSWVGTVAKFAVVALLAVLATKWYDSYFNSTPAGTPLAPLAPVLPSTDEDETPRSSLQYRPYCLTYHSKTTARILQTSMGSPSQQWSHIPCYAQPEKVQLWAKTTPPNVHINAYGFPDSILNISFSTPSFPKRQILGFGAAFTEASALNYKSLSERGKETLMELYFGKTGIGYSLGRVHINSCDFSVASYSFDDQDGDFDLHHFDMNVTHDNQPDGMMDMIRRATSVFRTGWSQPATNTSMADGGFKMYASPWSPPAWMKNPLDKDAVGATHAENMTGSTEPSCLREGTGKHSKYARAWALYFSKFLTACKLFFYYLIVILENLYTSQFGFNRMSLKTTFFSLFSFVADRNHGVPLWGITVQNEPEFPAPWEACAYTPKAEADFVAYHLGPQLREDHPDVKVLMFDHNKDHMITWAKLLLNKTAHPAHKYINGTAYHWYAGGMDRLLDGGVGSPNLHRFQSTLAELFRNHTERHDDHVILGSEACHCPYTGYGGGNIEIYWARAERYAHTILADLAAGSNGWVEWNLVLDSVGGPNHLNNLCDTGILAVPHRAINSTTPPKLSFEKTNHSFGDSVGDSRTRAELNALGFPAKYLDVGLAVQPMYFYMGHISKYVRPGSRVLKGLVEESKTIDGDGDDEPTNVKFRAFRAPGQVVAGGGLNDLARNGVEVTAWPCEGSTRQIFKWTSKQRIEVLGHDWLGRPTKSCLAREMDQSFKGIVLTECTDKLAATFDRVKLPTGDKFEGFVQFVQTNVPAHSKLSNRCLVLGGLGNGGGALGPRGGAQAKYGSCASPASMWKHDDGDEAPGEIISAFLEQGEVCLTTGWPFLQMGAFSTPNGESENTVVLLNEARDSANYIMYNGSDPVLSGSIPPRSIQTVLLDDI
eukprot:scaffold2638_cov114-Cylindrotheca_fusiformis.AAC.7